MGVTATGIRYPEVDSPTIQADIQAMMEDIDARMQWIQARAAAMNVTYGCEIRGGTGAAASGAATTLSFTTETFDSAGIWAAGTPNQFVVPAGIWLIMAYCEATVSAGSVNWCSLGLRGPGYTTNESAEILSGPYNTSGAIQMSLTKVACISAPFTYSLYGTGVGSAGGNFTYSTGVFSAKRLRSL